MTVGRSSASIHARPTATRSPAPCAWPRTGRRDGRSCATPMWSSSRIPAGSISRPDAIAGKLVDAPVPPLRGDPRDLRRRRGGCPPDGPAPVGTGRTDRGGKQQRRALSRPRSPACPGGDGLGPLGPVAPRPRRAPPAMDRLRRPGGDGPGPGRPRHRIDAPRGPLEHADPRPDPDPRRRRGAGRSSTTTSRWIDRGLLLPTGVRPIDRPDRHGQQRHRRRCGPTGSRHSTFREWHTLRTQALSVRQGRTPAPTPPPSPDRQVLDRGGRFLSKHKRAAG